MSENNKNDKMNEANIDETKVLSLAEIDAQMKDAYKLLHQQDKKADKIKNAKDEKNHAICDKEMNQESQELDTDTTVENTDLQAVNHQPQDKDALTAKETSASQEAVQVDQEKDFDAMIKQPESEAMLDENKEAMKENDSKEQSSDNSSDHKDSDLTEKDTETEASANEGEVSQPSAAEADAEQTDEATDSENIHTPNTDADLPTNVSSVKTDNHQTDKEQTVSETAKTPITLEEKRRKQRESKMTIEERRKRQQEDPKSLEKKSFITKYWMQANGVDFSFMVLLVISELLNVYFSFQIMRYIKATAAIWSFLLITLLLIGCLLLTAKKRKFGLFCNGMMAVLLLFGSVAAYRSARFSNKVFDNTESETVMIVAKKDAAIEADDDFTDKKLASVKFEAEINKLGEILLADKGKQGYITQEFTSYQDAYDSLMKGKSDIMIYTLQMEQRLAEADIHSNENIKILFERKRERKAVKAKAVDITKDSFNVLVSGVDLTSKNINEKGSSDVNILLTVNPKTKKMIMQTIPRDSWAPLTCSDNLHTKLTYAGAYGGIDCSINTIEKMYGITVNYYLKINFQGVMDLVDAIGGITVNNDIAFCTPYKDRYDTERETCFHVGENRLDGAQALIYARVRKLFSDGDIERGRHQMEVINGIIREFKQAPSMGKINSLLGAVENNFTTNLSESEIIDAFQLFMSMKDHIDDIPTYTMEGEMLWNNDEITNEYLYYFYPKDGQVDLLKARIHDIMKQK